MTPLRQRMIAAMQMRGFSPRTHESYLDAVRDLAKFPRRSPDTLEHADLTRYSEHLVVQRSLAPASVRLIYNGIRFFYLRVLAWPTVDLEGLDHNSAHPGHAATSVSAGRVTGRGRRRRAGGGRSTCASTWSNSAG